MSIVKVSATLLLLGAAASNILFFLLLLLCLCVCNILVYVVHGCLPPSPSETSEIGSISKVLFCYCTTLPVKRLQCRQAESRITFPYVYTHLSDDDTDKNSFVNVLLSREETFFRNPFLVMLKC